MPLIYHEDTRIAIYLMVLDMLTAVAYYSTYNEVVIC